MNKAYERYLGMVVGAYTKEHPKDGLEASRLLREMGEWAHERGLDVREPRYEQYAAAEGTYTCYDIDRDWLDPDAVSAYEAAGGDAGSLCESVSMNVNDVLCESDYIGDAIWDAAWAAYGDCFKELGLDLHEELERAKGERPSQEERKASEEPAPDEGEWAGYLSFRFDTDEKADAFGRAFVKGEGAPADPGDIQPSSIEVVRLAPSADEVMGQASRASLDGRTDAQGKSDAEDWDAYRYAGRYDMEVLGGMPGGDLSHLGESEAVWAFAGWLDAMTAGHVGSREEFWRMVRDEYTDDNDELVTEGDAVWRFAEWVDARQYQAQGRSERNGKAI